jgi:hypothetical protein
VSTTVSFNTTPLEADAEALAPIPAGATGWGIVASAILGAMSFGILPALAWPQKFCDIADRESDRLRAAVKFAAGLDSSKRTLDLLNMARARTRARYFLSILSYAMVVYVSIAMFMQFRREPFTIDRLMPSTFGYRDYEADHPQDDEDFYPQRYIYPQRHDRTEELHMLWCVALSVAYGAQWLQVRLHRKAVRRFVKVFNGVVEPRGILPVQMRDSGGYRPLTVVGAIVFGAVGAWWGIPMLLAASAQSRYTLLTRRSLAVQFADRLSKREAPPRTFERRCATPGCQAVLPPQAKFCPTCGAAVPKPMVDQVG